MSEQIPQVLTVEGGTTEFVLGEIRFPVDGKNILEAVKALEKLAPGVWAKMAELLGLPAEPFDKKHLKPVLMGAIQIAWYRALGNKTEEELKRLDDSQAARTKAYLASVEELKANPKTANRRAPNGTGHNGASRKKKGFRLSSATKEEWSKMTGQKAVIVEFMVGAKAVGPDPGVYLTIEQIGAGIKDKLQTRQPPERVAAFYMNDWGHKGYVDEQTTVPQAVPTAAAPEAPTTQAAPPPAPASTKETEPPKKAAEPAKKKK